MLPQRAAPFSIRFHLALNFDCMKSCQNAISTRYIICVGRHFSCWCLIHRGSLRLCPPPVPRFNCSRLVHENTLFMVEIHRCENTAPLFCLLRLVSSLLHCALDFMGHRDGTPLADPGGPGRPAPLAPKIFLKSCSFQYFEQILGSGPPLWVKTPLGSLTQILDSHLAPQGVQNRALF